MANRLIFLFAAFVLVLSTAFVPPAQANNVQPLAPTGQSFVRVLHAVPGAPAVDVWIDGGLVIENLSFGEISDYLSMPSGSYDVEVFETGTTTTPIIDAPGVVFASGQDYTIAARLDGTDAVPEIYEDNNTLPADGKVHVRFIHLSPDAPAVDVAVTGGPDLFTNVAYADSTEYLEVDPGTYDLEVRQAGTSIVALPLPGISLQSDTVYTVFAVGEAAATPATLDALLAADAGYARIRVVHAVPDAGGVDVLLDGSQAAANLEYQDLTPYLRVPSGAHNIVVVPTGTTTPEVINTDVLLNPMQDYTIAAAGLSGSDSVEPLVFMDDNSFTESGQARLRFIHLSPNAPPLDLLQAGTTPELFSDIEFGEASDYAAVDAGTYNLEVQPTGADDVVLTINDAVLQSGNVYTVYVFGLAEDAATPLAAVLGVDFEPFVLSLPIIGKDALFGSPVQ